MPENNNAFEKIKLISSMLLFGTIGIFVKKIPLPSSVISLVRGVIGIIFLLIFCALKKEKLKSEPIKKNLIKLILSGAALGLNWMLLFESYRYITVATATLCYYLAPVFIVLASAVFFKEKLTLKKIICVLTALIGMTFISGITKLSVSPIEVRGIVLALSAAILYAFIVVVNKTTHDISAYEKTVVQLIVSSAVMLPYVLLTEDITGMTLDGKGFILLLIVGAVHTGLTYALYFSSIGNLPTQTVALLSYLDPLVAVLLSVIVLHEEMKISGIIGMVLILGSTFVEELTGNKENAVAENEGI